MPKPKPDRKGAGTLSTATEIRGARMHNLQGIDCSIPRGRLTVITGVSGSGKSTLAFDVLYAEGQRRFVECLSAYARQFLERLERPEAEAIGHIQPPIALKQMGAVRNARSTMGSITELSDHLRLLYVHAGKAFCPDCGQAAVRTEMADAIKAVRAYPADARLAIVAPFAEQPRAKDLELLLKQGFGRVLTRKGLVEIEDVPRRATIRGLVIDRVIAGRTRRQRLAEDLQTAWKIGAGQCLIYPLEPGAAERPLREGLACGACGRKLSRPSLGLFSWNSPLGACPTCQGFGRVITLDREKVVPDPRRNLRNDAVVPFSVPSARAWYRRMLKAAREGDVPTDVPFGKLPSAQQDWVIKGDDDFPGVEGFFAKLERKRYKMHVRIFISRFRGYVTCPDCGGSRLKPEALAMKVDGINISEFHALPVDEVIARLDRFTKREKVAKSVKLLLTNILGRLDYLADVGVGYLALGRAARTLSGGETQRVRLAAALGSSLTDTLYILDEPTVGLHATDSMRMLTVMHQLTNMGNTVVVVEHDPGIISGADHLIVLGPGGGSEGGRKIYEGDPRPFLAENPLFFIASPEGSSEDAARAQLLHEQRQRRRELRGVPKTARRRSLKNPWSAEAVTTWLKEKAPVTRGPAGPLLPGPSLRLSGVRAQNLDIPEIDLPLGRIVAITGISGSGKSTLLEGVIYRNWLRASGQPVEDVGEARAITGFEHITEVHLVGQSFLGRSSRSNPISFVQAYPEIRKLLATSIGARHHGLAPGAFSFNTPGGRCETCRGVGTQTLEMYFLPDVQVTCEACNGRRFRREVLEVTWREKNIADILEMTVDESTRFFRKEPKIVERLGPLREVGLGYITLGQSTATLSGGEVQRLRLASFLAKSHRRERHLFLFDEPTTGLHARDIEKLLKALRSLIAHGHSVLVVEHHLDLIRAADWVVDLGPGAGPEGGRVVYEGRAHTLLAHPHSLTATALREHLERTM